MTLRQYLVLMSLGTLMCYSAFGFIVWTTDPSEAGFVEFLFFYVSLFLAVLGTFSVIGFVVKQKFIHNEEIIFRHVKRTFRQGAFVAFLVVLILFLRQLDYLNWWLTVLLGLLFLFLEGLIFTNRKYKNLDYV